MDAQNAQDLGIECFVHSTLRGQFLIHSNLVNFVMVVEFPIPHSWSIIGGRWSVKR